MLIKSVDEAKLEPNARTLEGRIKISSDLDKLVIWSEENKMKLIKDNCRALCFGRNNFIQQMQDGGKSGCGSAEKVEDPKPNMGWQWCTDVRKANPQQGRGAAQRQRLRAPHCEVDVDPLESPEEATRKDENCVTTYREVLKKLALFCF